MLELVRPLRNRILGVRLGSAERGNPPSKFARYFAAAHREGYRTTCHAGEEGPASYVREALDVCQVERIDHGYTAAEGADGRRCPGGGQRAEVLICAISGFQQRVAAGLELDADAFGAVLLTWAAV
ncbi:MULTISPECIES: hypothetical protein [Amycolatopsis]|uniref:hypothetical protein n=1 Tax=Amycolatopsis TaxID=1813 RepID=UPI003D154276